jgi:hypothetical protein
MKIWLSYDLSQGSLNLSELFFSTRNFMYFHFCYSHIWFWKCCTLLFYYSCTKNNQHVFPMHRHHSIPDIDILHVFVFICTENISYTILYIKQCISYQEPYATYYTTWTRTTRAILFCIFLKWRQSC